MRFKRNIIVLLIVFAAVAFINYSNENNVTDIFNSSESSITPTTGTRLHFLDVGQGDCTIIESNGECMLIDAGVSGNEDFILNYLDSLGIEKLNYVIATHPHADHIGSMSGVIDAIDVDNIIMPKVTANTSVFSTLTKSIKNKGLTAIEPQVGDEYSFGDCSFTIIAPYEYDNSNLNNDSVGIKLIHDNDKFLLLGDAEKEVENDILENNVDVSADLFKVSHHGSNTANTSSFIDAVNPEYAVISCAKENDYGHPHEEVMETLSERNIKVYGTYEGGTVVFTSTGNGLNVDKGVMVGTSIS